MNVVFAATLLLLLSIASARVGKEETKKNRRYVKAKEGRHVRNQFIIGFDANVDNFEAIVNKTALEHGAHVLHLFPTINAVYVKMPPEAATRVLVADSVSYVEEDQLLSIDEPVIQPVGPQGNWGLDRIDERRSPGDGLFSYVYSGTGVDVYVIDTGIRTTHVNFEGRAKLFRNYLTTEADTDLDGHGTHIAGIVGAATYGVAQNVAIWSSKACFQNQTCPAAIVAKAIEDCGLQAKKGSDRRVVCNLSLAGLSSGTVSAAVDGAIRNGAVVVGAAGNLNANACLYSPASNFGAIAVGATTIDDRMYVQSNWGTCVDILAPGVGIRSLWNTGDNAFAILSGTSMAAGFVSGAAAMLLSADRTLTSAEVKKTLEKKCVENVILDTKGSPNCLLNIEFISKIPVSAPVTPEPRPAPTTASPRAPVPDGSTPKPAPLSPKPVRPTTKPSQNTRRPATPQPTNPQGNNPQCGVGGESCSNNVECCSNLCLKTGECSIALPYPWPGPYNFSPTYRPVACDPVGAQCVRHVDCCSGKCQGDIGNQVCKSILPPVKPPVPQPPQQCLDAGASCTSSEDCCSNRCRGDKGAKVCRGDAPQPNPAPVPGQCLKKGQPCKRKSECCSKNCQDTTKGKVCRDPIVIVPKTSSPSRNTCRVDAKTCTTDSDCCSNRCSEVRGKLKCTSSEPPPVVTSPPTRTPAKAATKAPTKAPSKAPPSGTCQGIGEPCSVNRDCCSDSCRLNSVLNKMLCFTPPKQQCTLLGLECSSDSDCCSNKCLMNNVRKKMLCYKSTEASK